MSSDSSDEENLEFLREATDSQFLDESMYREKNVENQNSDKEIKKLPSLRKAADEDEQFNLFRVTPEFRNFVAKRLTKALDHTLSYTEVAGEISRKRSKKSYVKLLKQSEVYLKPSKRENCVEIHTKRTVQRSRTLEVPEEELRRISVNPEDILTRKETESWSTRSKAPVFNYKTIKTGELVLVE